MKRLLPWSLAVMLGCTITPPALERCSTNADCSSGGACIDSVCQACRSDSDCTAPARCGGEVAGRCGCADADGDGARCDDCDDRDPARFPGATEVCDERDNDCDEVVDDGALTSFFVDSDGDGYGNEMLTLARCVAPTGFVPVGGDCNDSDGTSFPGRVELCDFRDNDCDGEIDEGVRNTYFRDADGDGYGDSANTVSTCQTPSAGFVAVSGDCDDTRSDANPGAIETCNSRDDDCDGVVDGQSRSCDNACGPGTATCSNGLWLDCNAPIITTINAPTRLSGLSAQYVCLNVTGGGRLEVPAGMRLEATNWIRAESNGVIDLGPRTELVATGEIVFADQSVMLASDTTLRSSTAIRVNQDAKWFAQFPQAAPYSSGGSPACAAAQASGVGGATGGARGGTGGQGGTCGPLLTLPRQAAGGPDALNGVDGCDCACSQSSVGPVTAGGGGGTLAGGGGGANGGAGGAAGAGYDGVAATSGGAGGSAETALVGGAGGGSSGATMIPYAPEACQGGGGHGGGIVRIWTPYFANRAVISADGSSPQGPSGSFAQAGGGGGGAGGTWVFSVDRFENLASISAIGGQGANGAGGGSTMRVGGGGGGGGGRILITAADGGLAQIISRGNLFVGGGLGGTGLGGAGAPGGAGVIQAP